MFSPLGLEDSTGPPAHPLPTGTNRGGGGNGTSRCARILHYIDRLAEKDEQKQLRDRELAEKDGQKQLHNINSSAGGEGGLLSPKPRGRKAGTYNCSEILSYIGGLDGEQKQLINKLVNFCMINGKRTRARAIAYQTFHRLARTERDVIKLLVNAVENIKPICEVGKVRVAGTTYNVPEIAARDRQQTLAIRWILGAAFKRRISNGIGLDKCLSAEILDAHRKRGIARKKRDDLHELASTNRSFAHFRWW